MTTLVTNREQRKFMAQLARKAREPRVQPAGLWAEWIMNGKIAGNTLVQTQARTLAPDGIRRRPWKARARRRAT